MKNFWFDYKRKLFHTTFTFWCFSFIVVWPGREGILGWNFTGNQSLFISLKTLGTIVLNFDFYIGFIKFINIPPPLFLWCPGSISFFLSHSYLFTECLLHLRLWNSYLSHRIMDSLPRILKWEFKIKINLLAPRCRSSGLTKII